MYSYRTDMNLARRISSSSADICFLSVTHFEALLMWLWAFWFGHPWSCSGFETRVSS